MKILILLREYANRPYVWREATYTENNFVIGDDIIRQANIVAVANDNRSRYKQCSVCGKIFRKGSKEWTEHTAAINDTSKCLECQHLRRRDCNMTIEQYTLLPNERYEITLKGESELFCARSYNWKYIDSQDARNGCIHNRCVNAELNEITDFFTRHPNAFDTIITTDALAKVGYTDSSGTWYKLRARQTIWAVVNGLNIIDHFVVVYRYYNHHVYYSKKYDKLFVQNNRGQYEEFKPYNMSEKTIQNIHKKISEMYK